MESLIDQKYRRLLLDYYLQNHLEVHLPGGVSKWTFACPFCSATARTEGKKRHRKAALLWNAAQHSWIFSCARQGHPECHQSKTFPRLLQALNPELFHKYQLDRYHSGTTGRGSHCPEPDWIKLNKKKTGG